LRETLLDIRAGADDRAQKATAFDFYRGRSALYALLRALEVGPGDEVIVQAYTCLAVVLPIIGLGAVPVYVDILPTTYSMNPRAVAERISSRTRALIIQHTFGIPADLSNLLTIAREGGGAVIEDCCHVHGSTYQGRALGTFGAGAFYSFHWSKPLPAGRGGLAVVNDPLLAARVAQFHAACRKPQMHETASLTAQYLAFRFLRATGWIGAVRSLLRSTSPQGLASGQFRRAELAYRITGDYAKRMASPTRYLVEALLRRGSLLQQRRYVGGQLHSLAANLGISSVAPAPGASVAFMAYPLIVNRRDRVVADGDRQGVELTPGFVSPVDPLERRDWGKIGYRAGSCPVAEYLAERTVALAVHPGASARQLHKLLRFIEGIKGECRAGLDDMLSALVTKHFAA